LKKGEEFTNKIMKLKFDLTKKDIVSGNWKNASSFKSMNLNAKGSVLD